MSTAINDLDNYLKSKYLSNSKSSLNETGSISKKSSESDSYSVKTSTNDDCIIRSNLLSSKSIASNNLENIYNYYFKGCEEKLIKDPNCEETNSQKLTLNNTKCQNNEQEILNSIPKFKTKTKEEKEACTNKIKPKNFTFSYYSPKFKFNCYGLKKPSESYKINSYNKIFNDLYYPNESNSRINTVLNEFSSVDNLNGLSFDSPNFIKNIGNPERYLCKLNINSCIYPEGNNLKESSLNFYKNIECSNANQNQI